MNPSKYGSRIERLKARRQDKEVLLKAYAADEAIGRLTERFERAQYPESVRYALGCMEQVDDAYTRNTFAEGKRIANHLSTLPEYGLPVEFAYQGSVTNGTNIKVYSDIDLLVVIGRFYGLEPPLQPTVPYRGKPIDDLLELRQRCYQILSSEFKAVEIDNSGSKSISLSGGSLKRKVDVVPCDWYHTVKYNDTKDLDYRGIEVLDKDQLIRVPNLPFLHNKQVNLKDIEALGNFRPGVRLLKSLRADAENEITISSYAITSLLFHMGTDNLRVGGSRLLLVPRIADYLTYVFENETYLNTLSVPNETARLSEVVSKKSLAALAMLVLDLVQDLQKDMADVQKALMEEIRY